jgi:hypothetical protein
MAADKYWHRLASKLVRGWRRPGTNTSAQAEVSRLVDSLMAEHDRRRREVNSFKESLSDDATLAAFIERQLDEALKGLPMIWCKGGGLTIKRLVSSAGRWAWRRNEYRERTWYIYCSNAAGRNVIDLYYDLHVSMDLEAFVLTHSNITAGLWSQRNLIRKATLIPFTALAIGQSIYSDEALSLAQLVAEICLSCEPNFDWPT